MKRKIFLQAAVILVIYISVFCVNAFSAGEVRVPVLLYHNIADTYPEESITLHITPENFNAHLDAILAAGYHTISFLDYYNHVVYDKPLPDNPIIISFDDGYTSNYTYAYPELKERGMKGTIFVITGRMGADNTIYPHFTWEEAKEMKDSGVIDIQSHSDFHPVFTQLSDSDKLLELRRSRFLLSSKLGNTFFVFAYPYGLRGRGDSNLAKAAGYSVECLVGDSGYNSKSTTGTDSLKRLTVSGNMSGDDLLAMIESNLY